MHTTFGAGEPVIPHNDEAIRAQALGMLVAHDVPAAAVLRVEPDCVLFRCARTGDAMTAWVEPDGSEGVRVVSVVEGFPAFGPTA